MSSAAQAVAIPDRTFGAFLFDMDGTILTSIAAVERAWTAWGQRHGIDMRTHLPEIHGMRAIDAMRSFGIPGLDLDREAADFLAEELADMDGVAPIDGAEAFLASLPSDRWAIVTSAPRELAMRRLRAAGLPVPTVLVTNEEVSRGKPSPDCFLLAAERLGLPGADCLVFEDAPAGVEAAEAAGSAVVVITAVHSHGHLPHLASLASYERLRCAPAPDGSLSISLV